MAEEHPTSTSTTQPNSRRLTRSTYVGDQSNPSNNRRRKRSDSTDSENGWIPPPPLLPLDTQLLITTSPPPNPCPPSPATPSDLIPPNFVLAHFKCAPPRSSVSVKPTDACGSNGASYRLLAEGELMSSVSMRRMPSDPKVSAEFAHLETKQFTRRHRQSELLEKRSKRLEKERLVHERFKLKTQLELLTNGSGADWQSARSLTRRRIKEDERRQRAAGNQHPAVPSHETECQKLERVRQVMIRETEETLKRYEKLLDTRKVVKPRPTGGPLDTKFAKELDFPSKPAPKPSPRRITPKPPRNMPKHDSTPKQSEPKPSRKISMPDSSSRQSEPKSNRRPPKQDSTPKPNSTPMHDNAPKEHDPKPSRKISVPERTFRESDPKPSRRFSRSDSASKELPSKPSTRLSMPDSTARELDPKPRKKVSLPRSTPQDLDPKPLRRIPKRDSVPTAPEPKPASGLNGVRGASRKRPEPTQRSTTPSELVPNSTLSPARPPPEGAPQDGPPPAKRMSTGGVREQTGRESLYESASIRRLALDEQYMNGQRRVGRSTYALGCKLPDLAQVRFDYHSQLQSMTLTQPVPSASTPFDRPQRTPSGGGGSGGEEEWVEFNPTVNEEKKIIAHEGEFGTGSKFFELSGELEYLEDLDEQSGAGKSIRKMIQERIESWKDR